ncbi:SDR family NAD(P)-dependent oxidoreductase [Spongiactinospora sp. 9N601]|uniref:SDR family NAD(P)-dependent oxidoreductase n=1 Tax=Spongiactinospora sp. 9N601 TaxID=3375149 RepID=UPI0037B24E62
MDLSEKTVLITGSTGGIGGETARGLARLGARVLLVGRDQGRALDAAARITRDTGNDRVEAFTADVTRLADLRDLAERVGERHDALHVLINNAGTAGARRELTPDGVETMFAAHVLAPFTLTHLLLPLLRAGAPARVVNVTGGIPGGPIDLANLQAERRLLGWTFSHYNHTKTIQMAMSHRFAELVGGTGVTVNVVYPGHGSTPMNRAMTVRSFPYVYRPIAPLVKLLAPIFMADLTKPARSGIRMATDPALEGVTGAYFGQDGRRRPWPSSVLDERVRDRVWALCEELSARTLGHLSH